MTDPGPAESCQVSFLVPHPERTAVMVADGRLPSVSLSNPEPLVSDILASIDVLDIDAPVVLRQVMTSTTAAEGDGVTLLVECDAAPAALSPWTWLDLDAQ